MNPNPQKNEQKCITRVLLLIIICTIASYQLQATISTSTQLQSDTVNRPATTVAADKDMEYLLGPGENAKEKIRKNLFVKASSDKTEYYAGEPVIITYKLYSRLIAKSKISRQPLLNGFSVYDMIDFISNTESTELVNNRPFKVHVLRKAQLIPLQTGLMQLDPIEVENSVHFVKSTMPETSTGNKLDDLINRLSTEESLPSTDIAVKIESRPVTIVVKPFPDIKRPEYFSGAVGNFSIRAFITDKNLSVNDAGVLKVEIKGTGNLSLIDAPIVKWPAQMDTLNTRFSELINKSLVPMNSVKTFEYTFSPLKEGNYEIPPVSFSFFNAARHSYQTIQTQQKLAVVVSGNSTARIQKERIIPASSSKSKFSEAINLVKQQRGWILFAGLLMAISIYFWRKNINLRKQQKENALIRQPLKEAAIVENKDILLKSRALIEADNIKAFYRELNDVLWHALGVTLNLPPTALNKQRIESELVKKGWTGEMTDQLNDVLLKCERSIYLPDYQQETDASSVLKTAEKLVSDLQA